MSEHENVCPIWVGYLLANPLRKLVHNPDKILSPYINKGMKIVEIGPGMGFFSIPLARMTGKEGRVYCIDIQQTMLDKILARAEKKGFQNIDARLSNKDSYNIDDLKQQVDFVLLFAVVHEVPDQNKLFIEVASCLKPGGKLLFVEPSGHVTISQMRKSIAIAETHNLKKSQDIKIKSSHSVVFIKN